MTVNWRNAERLPKQTTTPPALQHPEILILGMSFKLQIILQWLKVFISTKRKKSDTF